MKYAVIGGDRRAALLAGLLLREGHRVHSWALERAQLPEEVPRSGSLQAALYGADAVLLPLPAARGELLNAPFAARPCPMAELEEALWPGQLVFGGGFTEAQRLRAERSGLTLIDWLRRPALVIGNAAITAEGAVGLLLQESERTLAGSRALVLGYGRIGRVLARLLTALGARTAVAARTEAARAEARAMGAAALPFEELGEALTDCDYLVNTVPARVLDEGQLCCLPEEALLLELASAPGGFDRALAENLGLRCIAAPGLPGTAAPRSAAELMRAELERAMKEERDA